MRSARRGWPAVAATVALLVTGCAAIPTSGAVQEGAEVQAAAEDPFIRVLPRPPAEGLGPVDVVRGFLTASASFENDHAVARLYLTPDASSRWDATAGVTVYDDDRGPVIRGDASGVQVRTQVSARIDADGLLSPQPDRTVTSEFSLVETDAGWRISELPAGLLLSRADIERSFRPFDLYFLTPEGDRLVPDPVFIPISRPGSATSLVRALLDGPTPWLAPAVRNSFPSGTTTVVDAVPVENGVAAVDLSAEALQSDDADRERMAAQLVWTLTQLPEVTAVSVTVEGTPLALPGVPEEQTPAVWAAYDPDAPPAYPAGYVVRRGGMAELVDGSPRQVPGVLGGAVGLSAPSATFNGDEFAGLTAGATALVTQTRADPGEVSTVLVGSDLAPPSYDEYDRLWVVDRRSSGSVAWIRSDDGRLRRVLAPALADRRVLQLRVAPDGTRAAVVVERRDGSGRLFLARVVRADNAVQLDGLRRLERQLVDVRDVAWQDADRLVALARRTGSVLQPFSVGVDGTLTQAGGSLLGIVGLAAASGQPLLAATDDGRIWQDTGLGWRSIGRGRDPAYAG